LPKISNYNTILLLDKQRFYCKHCHHTFTARTNIVGFHKQISNNTETSIKLELMNKTSEKDISKHFNVSHNKVNRIIHELSCKTVLSGTFTNYYEL
jgi:transposase